MPILTRCESGYEIRKCRPTALSVRGFSDVPLEGALLGHERLLAPLEREALAFDPLKVEQPICRLFAELRTEASYLEFAKAYGLLGVDREALAEAGFDGEPLAIWAECVTRVWRALTAWDALHDKRRRRNLELFVPRQTKPRDRAKEVARKLRDRVNIELRKHVAAGLRIAESSEVPVTFALDYEPGTLLGVIWLQCAWIVTGNRDYRVCRRPRCSKWLVLGWDTGKKGRRRKHAVFCSDHCRASFRQELLAEIRRRPRRDDKLIAEEWNVPLTEIQTLRSRAS